ncbi:E3 ubiquitin-protein ligase MIB2-like [Physella acuta]|uniref:E3 ubiquitin-protein ligase MIB2-like n=1 Tax=Physella acuta TaxID=109671 RepID=UPI0027DC942E|nr:E3 ubiquitin-protein ligase MIB2-like [Physella acuta]XP_059145039.1 E3 ubiquitin-protein ligase MIB2-like [Physella acuta]XP_059145040.1 E3 ubiquitin-protein ligase MIB2-like [Physella acuta]XP_059145042.1 E3 ubiquitin-protein ligase MIB2-like [Physella acuta]
MSVELGVRVVRGPDWKWGNQDNGEGHVGTVVEIGKPGSQTSPDKTVVVQWDSGARTNYRVGYQGAYDLRVYDNAPCGVKHTNIICDNCRTQGVQGMRWKCTKCHDFDLCMLCYMNDKHDLQHAFLRFDNASSKGIKVPKRCMSQNQKVPAFGIYSGARVARGPDWDWGNQDGGEGKVGKVTDIRGWDTESGRSVAHVTWSSGSTNVYRMGHKGKVDLKYTHATTGGHYYRDHLPVLGEFVETDGPGTPSQFKVGDKVRCDLDVEILKQMQEGHGGWNPRMAEYINKVGTVHRITDRGDVRVQYEGCANRWTFHTDALTKVHVFHTEDFVKISDNLQQVKEWQAGHGEWTDVMKNTLGKVGVVKKVYSDGDLRVVVANQEWTFNPLCCTLVPHGAEDMNNTLGSTHDQRAAMPAFTSILEQLAELRSSQGQETGPDRLVREAAQGHIEVVRDILLKYPDKVDQQSSGKTALQVASHQGHKDIVALLLSSRASLEAKDEDGDTALHYSAFGNQPEVMQQLLSKGAVVDSLNNGGCSTLHVAVNKQHQECVRALLSWRCNVNIQDAYGDTALHDAIGKENHNIIEQLVSYQNIDFTLKNKRGFNVLHHAALKGNVFATEKILQRCPQIVDIKKDDGFSSLHLAALNGHRDVATTLLQFGADIEIRNNRQQTPLLLAVSQGHMSIIELLVTKGADTNVSDEDGDTCLHLALMRQTVATEKDSSPALTSIRSHLGMGDKEEQTGAAIACYLAQQGANLQKKNHQGKTPLEIIADPKIEDVIKQFATAFTIKQNNSKQVKRECEVCCNITALVTFVPCGHNVACIDCCVKMKKCIECKEIIDQKRTQDGQVVNPSEFASPSEEALLKKRLQELEDTINCPICMERQRNRVFQCGHATCGTCAESLKICPICRKQIKQKINLF